MIIKRSKTFQEGDQFMVFGDGAYPEESHITTTAKEGKQIMNVEHRTKQ